MNLLYLLIWYAFGVTATMPP